MVQFHRQSKGKQGDKSDENQQLTQISKASQHSPSKPGQVSIRKEPEEEKKINNESLLERKPGVSRSLIEEEKNNGEELSERAVLEWWEELRKGFVLGNVLSVVRFLNMRLEGVSERDIESKVH